MPKKNRRRQHRYIPPIRLLTPAPTPAPTPTPAVVGPKPLIPHDPIGVDGQESVVAAIDILRTLTNLPSDRAKARVMKFVQDYFDETHGH